ncbi:nucleolar protein 8-like isoform X2 [Limulus polyphemus]|uniref:Nucleolar protein 8-like isoform X2 n=1 Tax=Limulus polyphemus TaxID=6850 RepID=A0ABM1SYJ9_LIMPO|nr:nucleolar protein 8-like isoform X2 [Limulus polyphemus]
MVNQKRLFIGGISPTVQENDIKEKFSRFGEICGVEIREKTYENSNVTRFAYVDLKISDDCLAKCISVYNQTSWKGQKILIQLAKESFLQRLQREREEQDSKSNHKHSSEKQPEVFQSQTQFQHHKETTNRNKIYFNDEEDKQPAVKSLCWSTSKNNSGQVFEDKSKREAGDKIKKGNSCKEKSHVTKRSHDQKGMLCTELINHSSDEESRPGNLPKFGGTGSVIKKKNALSELYGTNPSKKLSSSSDSSTDSADTDEIISHHKPIDNTRKLTYVQPSATKETARYTLADKKSKSGLLDLKQATLDLFSVDDDGDQFFTTDHYNFVSKKPKTFNKITPIEKTPKVTVKNGPDLNTVFNKRNHKTRGELAKSQVLNENGTDVKKFRSKSNFSGSQEFNSERTDFHESWNKHQTDNEKRLISLENWKKQNKAQQMAIKAALYSVDSEKSLNKKIVFDSEEESTYDEKKDCLEDHKVQNNFRKQFQQKSHDRRKLTLFDGSGEDEEGSDEIDKSKEMFRIRSQFEGSKGKRLLNRQNWFGHDERFRMDEKFLESDGESDKSESEQEEKAESTLPQETSDDFVDVEAERNRNLSILESVVGFEIPKKLTKNTKKWMFKDTSSLRFDPSREDSAKFELKFEKKDTKKKKSKEALEEEMSGNPLPEVSREKFYQVQPDLKFGEHSYEKETEGFSVLKALGRTCNVSDNEDDHAQGMSFQVSSIPNVSNSSFSPWEKNPFKYDSSDDEISEKRTKQKYHMSSTPAPFDEKHQRTKNNLFFFQANDPRLQEGVEFFRRTEDTNVLHKRWMENRSKLLENLQAKRKKAQHGKKIRLSKGNPFKGIKQRKPQFYS